MKETEFRNWLLTQGHKSSTASSRISNVRRTENILGNIEEAFNNDRGIGILNSLKYSLSDLRSGRLPSHGVEMGGNPYRGTSTLKQAVNLYFAFLAQQNRTIEISVEETSEINRILSLTSINEEDKKVLVKYRIGHGRYREELYNYWGGCSVTNCIAKETLIASHIKPWSESEENEKTDVFNGLLLTPNYDKLFDRFLISFDERGDIIISENVTDDTLEKLGISYDSKLNKEKLTAEHQVYLEWHREKFNQNA